MAIDDYAFTAEDVKSRLHGLFEAAKAVDEFEFGCTLLRVAQRDRRIGAEQGFENKAFNNGLKLSTAVVDANIR
jgi:hypothetical protein